MWLDLMAAIATPDDDPRPRRGGAAERHWWAGFRFHDELLWTRFRVRSWRRREFIFQPKTLTMV
jgi:hypothetical protein